MASVQPSRLQINSETGRFQLNDRPKSPSVMMLVIQRPYCARKG